jgi:hypothetical protein
VRWGPKRTEQGKASGSPSERTAVVARQKLGRGAMALTPEAGGPVVGRAGKAATCLSMGEKE